MGRVYGLDGNESKRMEGAGEVLLRVVPKQSLGGKYTFPSWSLGTRV